MFDAVREENLRLHRCCFTGHRPEKLVASPNNIKFELEKEIQGAISDGFTVFISGMARGVDLWAAEIVLKLRAEGKAVRLIAVSPFDGFEKRWSYDWQTRYRFVMSQADLTKFICPTYRKDCFEARNIWMVNHSSRMIAVYNGSAGGTKNTIQYANQKGISIHYIGG